MRSARLLLAAAAALAAVASSLTVTPEPAAAEVVSPLTLRHDDAVYGGMVIGGNAVLTCPSRPADIVARCEAAMRGESNDNNNQFVMTRVLESPEVGTFDSSTARVTIPSGAQVSYARLFWGGNTGTYRHSSGSQLQRCDTTGGDVDLAPGAPLTTAPEISVDGGAGTSVTPENAVTSAANLNGPHYYTAEGDVTSSFASASTGSPIDVAVGDVWAPTGQGCVGGWSVVLVYEYPGPTAEAPVRQHVHIYGGHVLQRSSDTDTTVKVKGFYRYGTRDVRGNLTAHEGDRASAGDQLRVNGKSVPRNGATNNYFIGLADGATTPSEVGSPYNLGTDVDNFPVTTDVIAQGDTEADLTLRTRGDTYLIQEVALAVPVPDLKVTKKGPKGPVRPGDEITYQVTAENISDLDYPGATFTDDLTDVLDDAAFVSSKADLGTATYDEPKLTWKGGVPAGGKATVTYTLRVDDPLTGDGKLLNDVVVADEPGKTSNCEDDTEDPACDSVIPISAPVGSPPPGGPGPGGPGAPGNPDVGAPAPDGLATTGTSTRVWPLVAAGAAFLVLGGAGLWFGMRRRRNG
ncbi:DUF7927 domain-containing protein [Phytomonospora endophytica]|uniref:LPXTG-motif cell wall-anchored protein n=1 Tax=Phytomonospora endophytica TaxID=714109 RepID=A0A841F657_9ACTN|nr:LPXTG cell wall anchor domain-containing protein [Phytomonospora endophytica]MBB6032411.1 LPXTG-motif cell wall-anchored protein [Phytomonospora endophytica]GIG66443.1 hypothetical protein Pen01_27380 [Phytomonospora endophytica]